MTPIECKKRSPTIIHNVHVTPNTLKDDPSITRGSNENDIKFLETFEDNKIEAKKENDEVFGENLLQDGSTDEQCVIKIKEENSYKEYDAGIKEERET
eukprot:14978311-Ditylum_brightwellii.AAC.1